MWIVSCPISFKFNESWVVPYTNVIGHITIHWIVSWPIIFSSYKFTRSTQHSFFDRSTLHHLPYMKFNYWTHLAAEKVFSRIAVSSTEKSNFSSTKWVTKNVELWSSGAKNLFDLFRSFYIKFWNHFALYPLMLSARHTVQEIVSRCK